MSSIHTQMLPKALAAGATPKTPSPDNKGERFRRLSVWHVKLKMVLKLFKNGFHLLSNTPKKRWRLGLRPKPLPPKAREIAFGAYQSDTPRVRGANFHLRPGRQKPSVRHCPVAYRGFLAPGARMEIGAPYPRRVRLASAEGDLSCYLVGGLGRSLSRQRFLEYLGVNGTHFWKALTPFSNRHVRLTSAKSTLTCYCGEVWGGVPAANAFESIWVWMEPI